MKIENKSDFRVVPDTNVIIAFEKTTNTKSPNQEFYDRWLNDEFVLLYSKDTQLEYIKKLLEQGIDREKIIKFVNNLLNLGESVEIKIYHISGYPDDREDICFVLCAVNGNGTHIISYDRHLLVLEGKHLFKIVTTVPFLQELRNKLTKNNKKKS